MNKKHSKRRQRVQHAWRPFVIALVVAAFGVLASVAGALSSWSHRATDQLFLAQTPDPSIVIIAIDDASIGSIGRWPWDRSVHANIIRALSRAGARVIGYDVNFSEPQDPEQDNELASAIMDAQNIVLPVELTLIQDPFRLVYDENRILRATDVIAEGAVSVGHSNTPPDEDGVVRRIPVRVQDSDEQGTMYAFGYEVARKADPAVSLAEAPLDRFEQVIVHYPGQPEATYPTLSAADVLNEDTDLSLVKGATVFVGSTAPDLHDDQIVPTSAGAPMPGVEIHASLAHTFLTKDWLQPAPMWVAAVLLLLLGLIIGAVTVYARTRWSILVALLLWIGVLGGSFVAFDNGVLLDIVWPTITIIFAFAIVTIERRITAEHERRRLKSLFSRYVSPSVVETILADPSKLNLGGERRHMTVFFSDIRGFTSFSETMDPETLVQALNRYLDRMTDIVFQHEGVLDKYIGDAVMAFWNAPLEQDDHALRGVTTALDMRNALQDMNASSAFGSQEFKIGMGLHTGEMIVGNTGGKVHTDYTVLGDSVNLASRLEGLTKEYGVDILITQATVDELRGTMLVRRLDKVAVKGRREPVTVYEVVERMDKASMGQKEFVRSFEDALGAYFHRRFDAAVEACEMILELHPDDTATRTLLERAKAFLQHPPTPDWDGRWVYTKK